jgi:hypothetical protein
MLNVVDKVSRYPSGPELLIAVVYVAIVVALIVLTVYFVRRSQRNAAPQTDRLSAWAVSEDLGAAERSASPCRASCSRRTKSRLLSRRGGARAARLRASPRGQAHSARKTCQCEPGPHRCANAIICLSGAQLAAPTNP